MLKHSQQGLITSQQEGERVKTATTEGKQRRGDKAGRGMREGRGTAEEREMKMKLDRREAERLRDGLGLKGSTLILICMGLPPDVGFQEHLTHKLPNGPEDLLSALYAECPSMIPQPLSHQQPGIVT